MPGRDKRCFDVLEIERRAYGGFWSCRFRLFDTETSLAAFFVDGLGRNVVCKNDVGGIDFEGFINSMTLVGHGGMKISTTLDNMTNKIWVRFKDSVGTFTRSTVSQDLDSQARYGIKELVLSGGQLTSLALADNLAEQVMRRKRWPKNTPENLSLGALPTPDSYIEVQCRGYIRTLEWRTYNQTASTGVQSADLEIATIVASSGQFVASTELQANPIGTTKVYDADRNALDILFDIARLGDAQDPPQRWVLYMKEDRVLVYEPAAPEMLIE